MISSGGPRNTPPGTLTQLFFDAVERHDKPDALQHKVNGVYKPISSRALAERVRRAGLGLTELGVAAGDRVGIMSENRPEWAIADYACLTTLLSDVPLYPNLPAEQAAFILRDSGAVAVFVSDAAQAAKIVQCRASLPALRHVITFAADRHAGADLTLAELEARGATVDTEARRAEYRRRALTATPDDVATLIYTSGTTGEPKGVMMTHDNLYSNVMASAVQIPFAGRDTCLSFLPLSHIFERMAGHYLMFQVGCSIAYAQSMDTVPVDMQTVKPSLVLSVPRLYEKMYARVLENALAGGAVKQRIFFWARGVAERWADIRLAGGEPRGLLALQYRIAQKLVFSKLKARTGGQLRYFVSGGAPLAAEINKFFYAAGLEILEGYGLTETSPVIAVNTPSAFRIGTVGKPIPGVEVMIAADGEILTRGPHVMKGYYKKPEATREVIDAEGWFHTGDIGELHDDFLSITDRKKDIIVTAGGKNIAPQPIENLIKTNKYVSQAVVIGDKRKFPIVLIVPNWEQVEKYAKLKNIIWTDRAQLLQMPTIHAKMEKEVFGQLHGLARFEMPKKMALLEHDFSIERGELTPKLSVKRRVIDKTYKSVIDSLYVDEHEPAGV
ncbi:MAG: long-chain fatty acid--CoA ligase [Gemmatimonadaceae bacterium]|nr:long-chain fatty acid--CoA ligase [Gemmatimonadaceae bacterium]NUO94310.1 long-chain fatty acid--CoA ligase [Gemmatimonadaceae bacterium]NUR32934.1 long-chain fatty acid--CoA ligase [Gemmatimonadaceae bacterium]NUS32464.1 long-chain fatty acid--CoA ligase [Gemmatimonadaceae bacterium]NUS48701.1 long-chain fatty acid--CoA ligase [Gemmatimonadaceae bacterium]